MPDSPVAVLVAGLALSLTCVQGQSAGGDNEPPRLKPIVELGL